LEKRIFLLLFSITFSQFFYLRFFSEVSQDGLSLKEGALTEAGSFHFEDREEVRQEGALTGAGSFEAGSFHFVIEDREEVRQRR